MSILLIQAVDAAWPVSPLSSWFNNFPSNVTEGNLLIVYAEGYWTYGRTLGISDTRSNFWTHFCITTSSESGQQSDAWYAIANSSGPCTVTVTDTTTAYRGVALAEFSGVNAIDQNTATVSANGVNTISASILPSGSNEWALYTYAAYGQSTKPSPGVAWTKVQDGYACQSVYSQFLPTASLVTGSVPLDTIGKPVAGLLALFTTNGSTPALLQYNSGSGAIGTITPSFGSALTPGSTLIAVVSTDNTFLGSITSHTVSDVYGNVWTPIGFTQSGGVNGVATMMWACFAPNPSTVNISLTIGPAVSSAIGWIFEFSNITGFDVKTYAAPTGTIFSNPITTTSPNELLLSFGDCAGAGFSGSALGLLSPMSVIADVIYTPGPDNFGQIGYQIVSSLQNNYQAQASVFGENGDVQLASFYTPSSTVRQSYVQSVSHSNPLPRSSSISVTLPGVSAGNAILVYVYEFQGTNIITGVVDNSGSNTYTQLGSAFVLNLWFTIKVYLALNVVAGSPIIVASTNGVDTGFFTIQALEYRDIVSASAFDQQAQNGSSSGVVSPWSVGPSGVTTSANEVVVGGFVIFNGDNSNQSAGSGYAIRAECMDVNVSDSAYEVMDYETATTGAQTAILNSSLGFGTEWAGFLVTLKKASAPVSTVPTLEHSQASRNVNVYFFSTTSLPWNYANVAGNLLICALSYETAGSPYIVTVADTAGNTWAKIPGASGVTSDGDIYVEIWYAENCNAGANALQISTNTNIYAEVWMAEFSGIKASGSQDQSAEAHGTSSSGLTSVADSGPVTISVGNELLIQGLYFHTPGLLTTPQTFTPETGWTADWVESPVTVGEVGLFAVGYKLANAGTYNATGTVTFGYSQSGQKWQAGLATFNGNSVLIQARIVIPTFFQ